jgi:metallo-beta-lactamase family protein
MLLEINDAIEAAADRRAKAVLIRRIRQALNDGAKV